MQNYIEEHDHKYRMEHDLLDVEGLSASLKFPTTKPGSMVYMDDRGLRFEGVFPTSDEIKALFGTWTGYKSSQ